MKNRVKPGRNGCKIERTKEENNLADLLWQSGLFDDEIGDKIFDLFAKEKEKYNSLLKKQKKEILYFCLINSHKVKEGKFVWLKDIIKLLEEK